jgi:multidrug efflux pump subunit AcrA (membrane-fusion protein)
LQVVPLRVYVNVPESLAAAVKVGTRANLTFDSFPGTRFPAQVVATAGAIDPTTRTLRTQLAVPNEDGKLFPGAYTTIHFELESDSQALLVPENVLLFREEGPRLSVDRMAKSPSKNQDRSQWGIPCKSTAYRKPIKNIAPPIVWPTALVRVKSSQNPDGNTAKGSVRNHCSQEAPEKAAF